MPREGGLEYEGGEFKPPSVGKMFFFMKSQLKYTCKIIIMKFVYYKSELYNVLIVSCAYVADVE